MDIANLLDFRGHAAVAVRLQHRLVGRASNAASPDTRREGAEHDERHLMVDPRQLAFGDRSVFTSGDDEGAKAEVTELLESFGWSDVVDLGKIATARGTEMYLPLWLRIMGAMQNPKFKIKVVR